MNPLKNAAIVLMTAVLLSAPAAHAENLADLTLVQGKAKRVLTSSDLHGLNADLIDIDDPVYNKPKRYAGYWLMDILNLAGARLGPHDMLIFTSLDGYKATLPVAELIKSGAKGFVAFQDVQAPEGWEKVPSGKEMVSPAPYYLVWQVPSDSPKDIKLPWPYQLVEISVLSIDEAQLKLLPNGEKSAAVLHGFKIFRQDCIACHSLNLEGGKIGPELNLPKNILEYADRKFLKTYIARPSLFRAQDKMPDFNTILSDKDLDDLLDYLSWIGKHKIL